jgi:hypothetical protein
MSVVLVTPPAVEPIHLDAAKLHVRQDQTDDDVAIAGYIRSATRMVEEYTGRSLVASRWRLSLVNGPRGCDSAGNHSPVAQQLLDYVDPLDSRIIVLPKTPFLSIVSVTYTALSDGTVTTIGSSNYRLDADGMFARLWPPYGDVWPVCRPGPAAFTVTYNAGYVSPVTASATTDRLTVVGPGPVPADGDALQLSNSGGALPVGLSTRTTYYARDISGQTFKVAATSGGAAIDLTTDGTGQSFIGELPPALDEVLKQIVGLYYEHREAIVAGMNVAELPQFCETLDLYRTDRHV